MSATVSKLVLDRSWRQSFVIGFWSDSAHGDVDQVELGIVVVIVADMRPWLTRRGLVCRIISNSGLDSSITLWIASFAARSGNFVPWQ
jgi:hypothetical protein